jgi:hypothetical protein
MHSQAANGHLPEAFKAHILMEAAALQIQPSTAPSAQAPEFDNSKPIVKLTSFEGSKGLSAHVFVVGVHENNYRKMLAP